MKNIIMTEGIANQFKTHLQKSYDFLEKCDDNIDKCKLLTELGIPNNINDLKLMSYKQKGNINTLLNNVTISEAAIIDLDNKHSTELDEIADTQDDDGSVPTIGGSEPSQTDSPHIPVTNTPPTSSNDPSDNTKKDKTKEVIYYEFSTKIPDMESAGDIFANSEYSLTAYTNYLLYKYNINDEEIAKEIYMAVINYGKEYANNNNGLNPIEKQDENSIILAIYNILKDKENFDINKYLIFKNIDITNA